MKREDIEKAANDFADDRCQKRGCPKAYRLHFDFDKYDIEQSFESGAYWYINSVWHDASERPKDRNAQCLVEVKSGGSSFFLLSQFYHSGGFSFMDGINKIQPKRWAYIEDLLPNKEIKSIENEKDNV